MVAEHLPILESILTHSQPLGPISQEYIVDDAARNLLYDEVSPFSEVGSRPYMILLGRKGAGKSAVLAEIRLKLNGRAGSIPERLPKPGAPFIVPVMSWQHFHQIARNVSTQFKIDDLLSDLVPPEKFAELWTEMLWDDIIQHFSNYTHFPEARAGLEAVNDYMNADAHFQGSPEAKAKQLFDAAHNAIIKFLKLRGSRLYVLFDSMENYPVRNNTFSRILGGLFQALTRIHTESQVEVLFCIPEEIENFLTLSSSTQLKDLISSHRIRWRPIDLLRITAHRLRLFIAIHDEPFYGEIERLQFSQREDIHRFFSRILPPRVRNGLGVEEDSLAYIVRHTQLLPRHVLATFNAILSRNYQSTGGYRQVTEQSIRDGVDHVQRIIAVQILHPYERLYPRLISACREILPDLAPVCSSNDLKVHERRFKGRIEDDVFSVWDTLFQMGVIGRVIQPESSPHAGDSTADRYCYGQFHFNSDSAFGLATDSEYCFHPVFSRAFGIRRRGDRRVVYPSSIDMVTLS